jgi:hypothetical protein
VSAALGLYAIIAAAVLAALVVYEADSRRSRLSAPARILMLVVAWPLAVLYAALFAAWWLVSLGGRRRPFDLP